MSSRCVLVSFGINQVATVFRYSACYGISWKMATNHVRGAATWTFLGICMKNNLRNELITQHLDSLNSGFTKIPWMNVLIPLHVLLLSLLEDLNL